MPYESETIAEQLPVEADVQPEQRTEPDIVEQYASHAPDGMSRETLEGILREARIAPEPEQKPEQERAEQGQAEQPEEPDATRGKVVPLAALHEERRRRQELQERLKAYESQMRTRVVQPLAQQAQPTEQHGGMPPTEAARFVSKVAKERACQHLGIDVSEFDQFDEAHLTEFVAARVGIEREYWEHQQMQHQAAVRAARINAAVAELAAEEPYLNEVISYVPQWRESLSVRDVREAERALVDGDAEKIKGILRRCRDDWYAVAFPAQPGEAEQAAPAPVQSPRHAAVPRSSMARGGGAPTIASVESMSVREWSSLPEATRRKYLGG